MEGMDTPDTANISSWLELAWNHAELTYENQMSLINANVKGWPLMSSPKTVAYMSIAYLLLVKLLIVLVNRSNKGFNVKFLLFCYHLGLVVANLFIGVRIGLLKYKANDFELCTKIPSENSPHSIEINEIIWWFFVLRGVEFLDTIFLVLRKKTHKISLLHLYNHATMFPIWWFCTAFYANGATATVAFLHSVVHVLTHFYYAISILGPSFQKLIAWKKYLILMQILQFCGTITFFSLILYNNCDGGSGSKNDWFVWCAIYYSLSHLALIYDFYTTAYYKIMNNQLDHQTSNGVSKATSARKVASTTNNDESASSTNDFRVQATKRRPLRSNTNL